MKKTRKERMSFDAFCQACAAVSSVLALLAIALGSTEPLFADIPARIVYATGCMVACLVFCSITVVRSLSRRRALLKVLLESDRYRLSH